MIPRVEAEAFEGHLLGGTTKPSILVCRDFDTGERMTYAVKYRKSRGDHCYEFLCVALGQYFGIDTLEPAQVMLRPEFGESLRAVDGELAERAIRSHGWNFGTKYLPGRTLPELDSRLTGLRGDAASRIMAFDVLVSNHDRHLSRKVNLLADGSRMLILDHELAFGWTLDLVGFESWPKEASSVLKGHVFAGRVPYLDSELGGFTRRLRQMRDTDIERFFSELPDTFPCRFEDRIKEHLKRARTESRDFSRAVMEAGAR